MALNNSYRTFIKNMDKHIVSVGGTSKKNVISSFKTLLRKEKQFINEAKKYTKNFQASFYQTLKQFEHNWITIRPFLRHRQSEFSSSINHSLLSNDYKELIKLHFTTPFILKLKENWPTKFPVKLQQIINEITEKREKICVLTMALAISQSKVFLRKVPGGDSKDVMEYISIAIQGLLVGIDKHVQTSQQKPDAIYSTIINRISSILIETFNTTDIKIPSDAKKILYKINQIRYKYPEASHDEITIKVKEDFIKSNRMKYANLVTSDYINKLLNSMSWYSLTELNEENNKTYEAQQYCLQTPEDEVSNKDEFLALLSIIKELTLLQQKILILKGFVTP